MPSPHEISHEVRNPHGVIRGRFLSALHLHTGRNAILYYSGWLQKPDLPGTDVDDSDKNGFMSVIHGLDRKLGLDLLLHTPGGEVAATESLADYLQLMFEGDIRVIVPQLALSAGTMIACAAKTIIMGKHSSLGPIDPQLGPFAAHGVLEEFFRAHEEIKKDETKKSVWLPIIAQYPPTLVGECEKAMQWAKEIAREWLENGMLANDPGKKQKAENIVDDLSDHALTKSHDRHLSAQRCADIGLHVKMLEDDNTLQELILAVHHVCMLTMMDTPAIKIIENQNGFGVIQQAIATPVVGR